MKCSLYRDAIHYGIPANPPAGMVDYEDYTASRTLMNLFNDYRGFAIKTVNNGATYAYYH